MFTTNVVNECSDYHLILILKKLSPPTLNRYCLYLGTDNEWHYFKWCDFKPCGEFKIHKQKFQLNIEYTRDENRGYFAIYNSAKTIDILINQNID